MRSGTGMRGSLQNGDLRRSLRGDEGELKPLTCQDKAWLYLQHYMPIFRWVPLYNDCVPLETLHGASGKVAAALVESAHLTLLCCLSAALVSAILMCAFQVAESLPRDVVAGLTVGFMAVPQALSYAAVAGLSAQYGLYNAFVGLLPYVFFGTSPHLVSGPTAVMSLITRSAVPETWNGKPVLPMTTDPSDFQYARLTFLLAFLAGLIQVLLGVSGLGYIVNLVSQPVIVGFTSAAAFLIVATQFSSLLGVSKCHTASVGNVDVSELSKMLQEAQEDLSPFHLDAKAAQGVINATIKALPDAKGSCEFYADIGHLFTSFGEFKGIVILAGALCVGLLLVFKLVLKPNLPKSLKVLANTGGLLLLLIMIPIGATMGDELEKSGLQLVGHIDQGLPSFTDIFTGTTVGEVLSLVPSAVTVAAIGYMEAMTIAKTVARQRGGYNIDPSQELTALGICNLVCSQFSGYPVTGSFSRTAVNADSGAASGFAALIGAAVIGIACLTLTGVLAFLPKVVLASIILVAAVNLVEVEEAVYLFRTSTRDFVVFAVVFVLVLVLGVEPALIAGILLHWLFALTLTHGNKNPVAVLGFVPTHRATDAIAHGIMDTGDDADLDSIVADDAASPASPAGPRTRRTSAKPALAHAFNSSRALGAAAGGGATLTRCNTGVLSVPRERRLHLPAAPDGMRLVDLSAPGHAASLASGDRAQAAKEGRVCLIPFTADITFNNNDRIRTILDEVLAVYSPRVVVLDCRGVCGVDVSGASALRMAASDAVTRGSSMLVAGLGGVEGEMLERALEVHKAMHGPKLTRIRCCGVDCPCCGPAPAPAPGALGEDEDGDVGGVDPGVALRPTAKVISEGDDAAEVGGMPAGAGGAAAGGKQEHAAAIAAGFAKQIGSVVMFPSIGQALRHAAALGNAAAAAAAAHEERDEEEKSAEKEADKRNAALGLGKGGIGVPLSPMVLEVRKRAAGKRRLEAESGSAPGLVTRWQVSEAAAAAVSAVPEGGSPLLQLIPAWEALGGVDEAAGAGDDAA